MMTLVKVVVTTVTRDGEKFVESFSSQEYAKALQHVKSCRWGGTQYMTTIVEEVAARLAGGSACNNNYTLKKVYSFK